MATMSASILSSSRFFCLRFWTSLSTLTLSAVRALSLSFWGLK